jgi:DNA-binding MarR family transcriptional regulator
MPAESTQRNIVDFLMEAARMRRAVQAELRGHGISFALWWALSVTDALVRESRDAVSQQAIALATDLSRSTVSYLMRVLSDRALVDRGPDAFDCAYRVLTTNKGRALLAATGSALEAGLQRARAMPPNRARALAYCLARAQIED